MDSNNNNNNFRCSLCDKISHDKPRWFRWNDFDHDDCAICIKCFEYIKDSKHTCIETAYNEMKEKEGMNLQQTQVKLAKIELELINIFEESTDLKVKRDVTLIIKEVQKLIRKTFTN